MCSLSVPQHKTSLNVSQIMLNIYKYVLYVSESVNNIFTAHKITTEKVQGICWKHVIYYKVKNR